MVVAVEVHLTVIFIIIGFLVGTLVTLLAIGVLMLYQIKKQKQRPLQLANTTDSLPKIEHHVEK